MVSENGSISSTETKTKLAITQYIIKNDKITIKVYEETINNTYSDTTSSEEKEINKANIVIEHKDVELSKLDVSEYTFIRY